MDKLKKVVKSCVIKKNLYLCTTIINKSLIMKISTWGSESTLRLIEKRLEKDLNDHRELIALLENNDNLYYRKSYVKSNIGSWQEFPNHFDICQNGCEKSFKTFHKKHLEVVKLFNIDFKHL